MPQKYKTGRGKNHIKKPNSSAKAKNEPHIVANTDENGNITNYVVFEPNSQTPKTGITIFKKWVEGNPYCFKREYLIELLEDWKSGVCDSVEVYTYANECYPFDHKFTQVNDLENNTKKSVTVEVLRQLANLHLDLITSEDADAYIKFLKTKIGEYEKGLAKLESYKKSINFEKRKKALKIVYPYVSYFVNQKDTDKK